MHLFRLRRRQHRLRSARFTWPKTSSGIVYTIGTYSWSARGGLAISPRNLHHAVREGSRFGLNLDENMLVYANGYMIDRVPLDNQGALQG